MDTLLGEKNWAWPVSIIMGHLSLSKTNKKQENSLLNKSTFTMIWKDMENIWWSPALPGLPLASPRHLAWTPRHDNFTWHHFCTVCQYWSQNALFRELGKKWSSCLLASSQHSWPGPTSQKKSSAVYNLEFSPAFCPHQMLRWPS